MNATSKLRIGMVGGVGRMAGPMATQWPSDGPVKVVRVHDRGNAGERRERNRDAWRKHGAVLVSTFEELAGAGDIDGVIVCCGKNGDDVEIVGKIAPLLGRFRSSPRFICHLSTVNQSFVKAAHDFCKDRSVQYVHYPMTGTPLGVENKQLLILASGNPELYKRLAPIFECFGKTKYFGIEPTAATEVKLISHLMVFNGLMGMSSATAAYTESFTNGKRAAKEQAEFFDYLSNGAGGTRVWDLIVRQGIRDGQWNESFKIQYGAVDAVYAAQMCHDTGISRLAAFSVIQVALAFSYVLNTTDADLSIQTIVREFVPARAAALDRFVEQHIGNYLNIPHCIDMCIESFPEPVKRRVLRKVTTADFEKFLV